MVIGYYLTGPTIVVMWFMYLVHHSYLGVLRFEHVTPSGQMTCVIGFDWLRDMAQLTRASQLWDFKLRFSMSHELRDVRA